MNGLRDPALPVVARFRWEPREAYRALVQIARRGLPLWPLYISFLVLAAMNAGPSFVRQWERGGWAAVDVRFLAWNLAPVVLAALLVPVTAFWVAYRGSDAARDAEQIVAIGEAGVQADTRLHAGELRWTDLSRVVETGEFFLLYRARLQALYVPTRAVGGDAELQAVRALLRTHLGPRAELRRD